jgi:hypothetical protein
MNYNSRAKIRAVYFSNKHNSRMPSSAMWRRVGILLTDVSEERIASIFRVEEIHER